jgi:hypothetical protein
LDFTKAGAIFRALMQSPEDLVDFAKTRSKQTNSFSDKKLGKDSTNMKLMFDSLRIQSRTLRTPYFDGD